MRNSQAMLKLDYGIRVRKTPTYVPGNYDFIHNPPMRTIRGITDAVANQTENILQPRATGRFKIYQVLQEMLVMKQNGILETVPIIGATNAPLILLTAPAPSTSQR